MSSPPAYDVNPDRRPLPAGWITQYDPNYKTWFYVNTEANPPVTTWNHPSGPVSTPSPEPRRYSPPSAPPNTSTYPGGYNPAGGQGGYPTSQNYPQQPPFGGYGDSRGAEYEQNYPQQNPRRGLGGLIGRLSGHTSRPSYGDEGRFGHGGGGFGRPSFGGGYPPQQQQPQVVYVEQQPQRKSGIGGLALGAGAGLLGGVLLGEALENHDDYDRRDFDDGGFGDNGFGGNDFGDNNDFGGGDGGFF